MKIVVVADDANVLVEVPPGATYAEIERALSLAWQAIKRDQEANPAKRGPV